MRDAAATAPRSNRETISARTPPSYVASVVFQHRPHHVKDPIVAAAHVVTALQAIAARETDPLSSAVVSVTMFHAGDAYNVIPQGARIGGTLRSLSTEGLQSLRDRVDAVVHLSLIHI